MRGVPEKLATKQDLFNVCNDLHHGQAKLYLKLLPADELKRLGVTTEELKRLKQDIASRKRKETLENKERMRIKAELDKCSRRISELAASMDNLATYLRLAEQSKRALPDKEKALQSTSTELSVLGPVTAPTGLRALQNEVVEKANIVRRCHADAEAMKHKKRQLKELSKELAEIQDLERKLAKLRPGAVVAGEMQALRIEIKWLNLFASAAKDQASGLVMLHKELRRLRAQEKTWEKARQLQAQRDNLSDELKVLRHHAAAGKQTRQHLLTTSQELKAAKDRKQEIEKELET